MSNQMKVEFQNSEDVFVTPKTIKNIIKMSEIHIGSKKKLRKVINNLDAQGYTHNFDVSMMVPRHNGITVIVDHEKKEAIT